jgi:hypothetical protein
VHWIKCDACGTACNSCFSLSPDFRHQIRRFGGHVNGKFQARRWCTTETVTCKSGMAKSESILRDSYTSSNNTAELAKKQSHSAIHILSPLSQLLRRRNFCGDHRRCRACFWLNWLLRCQPRFFAKEVAH